MKAKSHSLDSKRQVLLALSSTELREPYLTALSSPQNDIACEEDLEKLYKSGKYWDASIVIIDLDLYPDNSPHHFQKARAQFPGADLIALSSSDSAQVALACIRSGFVDYLTKPASPEELVWSVKKCWQRQEVLEQIGSKEPRLGFAHGITRILSAGSPMLVWHYLTEELKLLLSAKGSAWIQNEKSKRKILSFSPKNIKADEIVKLISKIKLPTELSGPITKAEKNLTYILLAGPDYPNDFIITWGISKKLSKEALSLASILARNAGISLMNLSKLDDLKQQTFVDDLTGLYNSRFLKYAITNAIARCKKPDHSFSVLFIDVDHFKGINDTHGHVIGSDFLVAIGKTVRNSVRSIDPTFRYGGDEFVVILNQIDSNGAKEIAERIRKHIERRVFNIGGKQLRTTVSIGIASYPEHTKERETLLKMADEAMYGAKKLSRNAVRLATEQ